MKNGLGSSVILNIGSKGGIVEEFSVFDMYIYKNVNQNMALLCSKSSSGFHAIQNYPIKNLHRSLQRPDIFNPSPVFS